MYYPYTYVGNVHECGVLGDREPAESTDYARIVNSETSFYGQVHGCPITVPHGSSLQLMYGRIVCIFSGDAPNIITCPSHQHRLIKYIIIMCKTHIGFLNDESVLCIVDFCL